jgi:hypothetical protein
MGSSDWFDYGEKKKGLRRQQCFLILGIQGVNVKKYKFNQHTFWQNSTLANY